MTHPACLYSLDYYNVQQTQTHRGAELAGVFPLTLRNAGVMLVQCENQENPRVTPALKVRIWEITDRSQAYVALQEFKASISEYKRTAKQRKSHLVNSAIFPPVLIVFCSGIACTEAFAFVIPPQHVNKSTKRCPLDFTKDERRKFTISSVR